MPGQAIRRATKIRKPIGALPGVRLVTLFRRGSRDFSRERCGLCDEILMLRIFVFSGCLALYTLGG